MSGVEIPFSPEYLESALVPDRVDDSLSELFEPAAPAVERAAHVEYRIESFTLGAHTFQRTVRVITNRPR